MFSVDSNNNIELTIGDTVSLYVALHNLDGSEYTLADGDIIRFTVADQYCGKIVIQKNSASTFINFSPSDTSDLMPGVYIYDIKLITQSKDVYTPIGPSAFKILYGTHIVSFPNNSNEAIENNKPKNMILNVSGIIT